MKAIKKLAIVLAAYILLMIVACNYLTNKLREINASGESYLPSESPKLQSVEPIYYSEQTRVYEPEIASNGTIEIIDFKKNLSYEDDSSQNLFYGYTEDELNLIYAVVRQEGGPDYESALAVISTVTNRLNDDHWSWCGDTVLEQITHPGQYCYSIDDYWVRYLDGNVEDCVKKAVLDGLSGVTNHDYTCFRGYYLEYGEKIGLDNWYFYDY